MSGALFQSDFPGRVNFSQGTGEFRGIDRNACSLCGVPSDTGSIYYDFNLKSIRYYIMLKFYNNEKNTWRVG